MTIAQFPKASKTQIEQLRKEAHQRRERFLPTCAKVGLKEGEIQFNGYYTELQRTSQDGATYNVLGVILTQNGKEFAVPETVFNAADSIWVDGTLIHRPNFGEVGEIPSIPDTFTLHRVRGARRRPDGTIGGVCTYDYFT